MKSSNIITLKQKGEAHLGHCQTSMIPAGIYLLKFNNRNTRIRCNTCWKLTIKAVKQA